MFKCCVCNGKASRRTSQEDDEDESSDRSSDESSSSSSSSSEEDEEEEEREIEEELAKKFKSQNSNQEVDSVNESSKEENCLAGKEIVVEVNGDVRSLQNGIAKKEPVDMEAVKEDVADILNCAVKMAQQRLEKIKEEVGEDEDLSSHREIYKPPAAAAAAPAVTDQDEQKKPELQKLESQETDEDVVTVTEDDEEEGEYEIVDGSRVESTKTHKIEEMIKEELINDLNEEADNVQELKEIVEPSEPEEPVQECNEEPSKTKTPTPEPVTSRTPPLIEGQQSPPPPYCEVEIIEEIKKKEVSKIEKDEATEAPEESAFDSINSDLLNIPPPSTPPPELAGDSEKSSSTELDFPTPPPIDFDGTESSQEEVDETDAEPEQDFEIVNKSEAPPVPPWEPERITPETLNFLPAQSLSDSKPSSPGSKSLPSPPSPGSETGNETEAESKSSEDEQTTRTTKTKPCDFKTAYISRTMVDNQDDENDDSVFETVSLAKDPEVKDIPPRPGCEHDDREEHLEELVNRLESVTKRLEKVSVVPTPVQTQEIAVQTKSPSPERSLSLESNSQSTSSTSSTGSRTSVVEVNVPKSMSVAAYEDLLAGPVQEYLHLSQKIGGDVATHSKLVDKVFQIQLHFLKTATSRPAPTSQSEQVSLLGPTSTQIQEIQEFREKHRGSPFFNHLSAISESIPALGWVAVAPTPAPYVKEMNDAGQFYTNRVLKDWKEKDKTHVEWCKAWVKTLTDLQQFVRQHHTTGLVWAKTGSVPAGGVPPPPPPCMMPMADPAPAINDDRSALFAEINQGENITRNLKKVTSDMQTHKNTNLRTGPAPFKAPVVSNSSSGKTTLPANAPIDKPPVFTRDGKKWLVEYHKGNKNLVIDNVEMNNVVYIYRCQDSNVVIKGKINSVVMDSCRKSAVVVDSVVASIEFVNCQSVQMQVLGKVPTISIDKTDGCQMYLNNDTLGVELITSKSSEMNVLVPIGNGDYTEYPVPEQFKTVITKKGLSTIAVDSLG